MSEGRATSAVDQRLGARLRARRLEIGMSQERLAELLGVTFQQVQKYEKGVNRIAASRLFDIAKALDVSVCSFFEGIAGKNERAGRKLDEALARPEVMDLVMTFDAIKSDKVRRRVMELVRAMSDETKRS